MSEQSRIKGLSRRQTLVGLGAAATGLVASPAVILAQTSDAIRFGHLNNTDHPTSMGARKFAELVAAKRGGKIQIKE